MASESSYGKPQPFYLAAVRDTLDRGDKAEISALLDGARSVKAQYGDLDSLIAELEKACG
ncbi:MAG: hypothetical protein QOD42_3197 [Sphingomonadales bacterium]|jgi:hypothetical protein|nr:hypothetical protein [Sphingomonadales bacterium]